MNVFRPSYVDDRADFVATASVLGAQFESHRIPATGPHGEALTVGVARFGAEPASRLLVLVSGTRGVDGPAGSALQRHFMQQLQPHLSLPEDAAVLYVHALNPYGHAWHRTQNEDGVELAANFADFEQPFPDDANPATARAHAEFDALLESSAHADDVLTATALHALVQRLGEQGVRQLRANGQYTQPRGLWFGGNAPAASSTLLRQVFQRHADGVQSGLVIDLRTGNGEYGDCVLEPAHAAGSATHGWIAAQFAPQRILASPICGTGEWTRALQAAHPALRFLGVSFGTSDITTQCLVAVREQRLHMQGDRTAPAALSIVRAVRESACPSEAGWRTRVLAQGSAVLLDAWRALFGQAAVR